MVIRHVHQQKWLNVPWQTKQRYSKRQLTTPTGCSANPMSKCDDQCWAVHRPAEVAKEDEADDLILVPSETIRATSFGSAIEPMRHRW